MDDRLTGPDDATRYPHSNAMRFRLRTLLVTVGIVAVVIAIASRFFERFTAPNMHGFSAQPTSSPSTFPCVNGVTVFSYTDQKSQRTRIVALNQLTKQPASRDASLPPWFECSVTTPPGVAIVHINGKRIYPAKDVLLYWAVDDDDPKLMRVSAEVFLGHNTQFPHQVWSAFIENRSGG